MFTTMYWLNYYCISVIVKNNKNKNVCFWGGLGVCGYTFYLNGVHYLEKVKNQRSFNEHVIYSGVIERGVWNSCDCGSKCVWDIQVCPILKIKFSK